MLNGAGAPPGTIAAARLTAAVIPASRASGEALVPARGDNSNTSVNAPPEPSPKCVCTRSRTCSDCVPGTEKVFERIAESFELANPPRSRATIQTASTQTRCLITKRVQAPMALNLASGYG